MRTAEVFQLLQARTKESILIFSLIPDYSFQQRAPQVGFPERLWVPARTRFAKRGAGEDKRPSRAEGLGHDERVLGRPADLGIGSIMGAVWRYVVAAPLAGATARTIIDSIPALVSAPGLPGAIDRGLIAFVLFGALYLCAVIVLYRGTAPLHEVGALLRDMLPRPARHPDVPPPLVTSG